MMSLIVRKNSFEKYWEIARINYRESLTHTSNVIGSSLVVLFRVWVFTQLYTVTYQVAGVSQIGSFTLPMVIWTLVLVQSFQSATRPSVAKLIREEIQDGVVAYTLNRPYSYMLYHYFAFIGRAIPKLFLNIVISGSAAYILVGGIHISPFSVSFGLVLLLFGYTLDFLIYYCIGLLAFWIEDTSAIIWIYSKAQMIFGGIIVPISLLPEGIQKIATILPFSQLYYGAARIMVNFEWEIFERFLITQVVYITVFAVLASFIFRKVITLMTVNGG